MKYPRGEDVMAAGLPVACDDVQTLFVMAGLVPSMTAKRRHPPK
jgi:hypothetical protein